MNARPGILREAAKVIKRDGLAKGNFTDHHAHCTVGALMAARGREEEPYRVIAETDLLATMIGADPGSSLTCVAAWNDNPDRTPADVILLLEQAAEKAEADR